jgi:hypothetical protein
MRSAGSGQPNEDLTHDQPTMLKQKEQANDVVAFRLPI